MRVCIQRHVVVKTNAWLILLTEDWEDSKSFGRHRTIYILYEFPSFILFISLLNDIHFLRGRFLQSWYAKSTTPLLPAFFSFS